MKTEIQHATESDTNKKKRSHGKVANGTKPNDVQSLVQWQLVEEKREYSREREWVFILVGGATIIIAVLLKTYIFATLLILATSLFAYTNKQKPKKMTFDITSIGMFLESDFLSLEDIKSFNIIDDPGVRARLILRIEKVVLMNEIVPIYDVNISQIEDALEKLGIQKDDALEPSLLDRIASSI